MNRELRLLLLASLGLASACTPTIAEIVPTDTDGPIDTDPPPADDYGTCIQAEVDALVELEDGATPPDDFGQYVRCDVGFSYDDCMQDCGQLCMEGIADASQLNVDEWTSAYVTCGPMWLDGECCVQIYLDPGWDEGRPFLVDGDARLAAPAERADWQADTAPGPVSRELAAALAARWTRTGLQEHASVAAFSRFSLVLLHLGAPADLVTDTHRAALDEVRHAQLCFGLAAHYAGAPVGPGPLPVDDALDGELDPEQVLRTLFLEGCVGETIASLRARSAAEAAQDPGIVGVLQQIATDEGRHAALAWRTVRWLIQTRPALRAVLTELLAAPPPEGATPDPAGLEAHGVLGSARCAQISRDAHREVVLPLGRALLAGPAVLPSASV